VIRKRLVGVVTVKEGWAVQSIGYRRYLPLGRPEVLVENLDRWGADEIVVQCIDRARFGQGPDLALLERISKKGLATPLIYGGGIRCAADAVAVVQSGADRVCVDALLHDAPHTLPALAAPLGAQALIGCLPLARAGGELRWLDHRTCVQKALSPDVIELLESGVISEALVVDWRHEGVAAGFDTALLAAFPAGQVPLIAFGGISQPEQMRECLGMPRVSAVAVGNFLNYRELAIDALRAQLGGLPLRPTQAEAPR
jgi:cyclase